MYKFVVLATALACANAGLLGAPLATTYAAGPALGYSHALAPAAITSQSANILRSYGNLGQVSTYSKTIDTPYSSVSKSDVRVSNPGIQTLAATSPYAYAAHASPLAYASPAIAHAPLAYASPAIAHAPLGYGAPIARAGLVGVGYSAAPAVAHISYDSPISHYAW